jgi:hypothetical protein
MSSKEMTSRIGSWSVAAGLVMASIVGSGEAVAQTGQQFIAVTPCRIVDTRFMNPQQPAPLNTVATPLPPLYPPTTQAGWPGPYDALNPSSYRVRGVGQWDGTGNCGVPTSATAVSLNVTIVTPGSNGDVRIWPYGGTMPLVSTINVTTADTALANGAIVPMPVYNASNPDISLRFTVYPKGTGAHLVLDVTGYFQ